MHASERTAVLIIVSLTLRRSDPLQLGQVAIRPIRIEFRGSSRLPAAVLLQVLWGVKAFAIADTPPCSRGEWREDGVTGNRQRTWLVCRLVGNVAPR